MGSEERGRDVIYQGKARYPVHEAILHTSATKGNWWKKKTADQMRDEIDRWHKDRGWKGIGYHRVIAPNGDIALGRSIYEIGAHVKERNRGTVGICLIPVKTIEAMGTFETFYTPEQKVALLNYLNDLMDLTEIKWITGHNQYANKLCPGFLVQDAAWLRPQAVRAALTPGVVTRPQPPADHVKPAPRPKNGGLWAFLRRWL